MRIWVVGGTSGIGAACASILESAGHSVEISGRKTDVRSAKLLAAFADERGPFDGLVYSAGVNYLAWVEDLDCKEAAELYDVNVLGLIRAIQSLGNSDRSLHRIVVVGSDAAWRPMRTSLAYCASKAALHMAALCIARELAAEGFAINVVAPGLVWGTEMTEYVIERTTQVRGWTREGIEDYMVGQIPLARPADPVEVAMVVRDVIESPPYLNGAVIPVNGAR
jgi:NAD(P)-dependent dehydrogenase (short-subunit alcohol dehydrogenase family)